MAGCLLVMGLASCEMKNEILGKEDGSSEMGLLNLGVAVDAKNNDVQTKADANPGTPESIPSVSATGYIVEISNSTGVYKTLTYDPTNASVELPVDSYTMYAHKPGGPTETDPYYGGSTSFAVKKGEATDVTVTCKMENTKIQLVYSTEMQTSFTSWSITVKAGTRSKVLTYSGTEAFAQPSAFYWMLDEGVKEITVSFVGKNKDNKDIYFSIGGHPAYMCPINQGESFEDYYFEFDKVEKSSKILLNSNGLFTKNKELFMENSKELPLSIEIFKDDAIVFNDLKSNKISLKSRKSDKSVTMDFSGFPYLGLWTKPTGAPFVCIEPWFGHADYEDFNGDFKDKEGINKLAVGKSFKAAYLVTVQ